MNAPSDNGGAGGAGHGFGGDDGGSEVRGDASRASPSTDGGSPRADAKAPDDLEDGGDLSLIDGSLPSAEAGDAGPCAGPGARFATSVLSYQFGPGQNFGQSRFPNPVLGPPHGGSTKTQCLGGTDVVSLGNGGYVALAFKGNAIVDEPGIDFIVFENPFYVGCDPTKPNAELATVSVSEDGKTWVDFPCTATSYPYGGCSGWHPVYANPGANDLDPTDPAVAGGDPYDLADIGVKMARYVKITDRADIVDDVYDLDAVSIVHPLCE